MIIAKGELEFHCIFRKSNYEPAALSNFTLDPSLALMKSDNISFACFSNSRSRASVNFSLASKYILRNVKQALAVMII